MTTHQRIMNLIHGRPARLGDGAQLIDANAAHKLADAIVADGATFPGSPVCHDAQDDISRMAAVIRAANASMSGAEPMYDEEVMTYAQALAHAGMGDILEARIRELARTQTGFPEAIGAEKTGQQAFFKALKWFRNRQSELQETRGAEVSVSPVGVGAQLMAVERTLGRGRGIDGFEGTKDRATGKDGKQ
jgi:hypothetical protein